MTYRKVVNHLLETCATADVIVEVHKDTTLQKIAQFKFFTLCGLAFPEEITQSRGM